MCIDLFKIKKIIKETRFSLISLFFYSSSKIQGVYEDNKKKRKKKYISKMSLVVCVVVVRYRILYLCIFIIITPFTYFRAF